MSCPGLHCPGCSSGQSLGILGALGMGAVAAYEAVPWVAERIWWIGGTAGVCFVVSVAGCMWLERWSEVRCVRFAERHGIASLADMEAGTPAAVAYLLRRERAAVTAAVAGARLLDPARVIEGKVLERS